MPGWQELLESAQEQSWNHVHPRLDTNKSPQGEGTKMFHACLRGKPSSTAFTVTTGERHISKRYSTVSSGPLATTAFSERCRTSK